MSDYQILVKGTDTNKIVKGWTNGVPICENTVSQLSDMSKLPFIYPYIAVMPDAHYGAGSCVGSVIPTLDAIIPAAVGVDIGCGMIATKLNLTRDELNSKEEYIRQAILNNIPVGRSDNGGPKDIGGWQNRKTPSFIFDKWKELEEEYIHIINENPVNIFSKARTIDHLGTLGGGNHFIELAFDENKDVWLVIHSGSRGIGNKIGSYFTQLAKDLCKRWYVNLPNKDLAYFPRESDEYNRYWMALKWAQDYAWANRRAMLSIALDSIELCIKKKISSSSEVHCHHNYADIENHFNKNVIVTRKGAVRARLHDRGIIPGSMGEKSFIVKGKQDKDSLHSCSHGAGRVMSRRKAKNTITNEEHLKDTEGVFCDKTRSAIDESPRAYKDIEKVMKAQESLIEIEHTLKAFINVKGIDQ